MYILSLLIAVGTILYAQHHVRSYPAGQMTYRGKEIKQKRMPIVLDVEEILLNGDQPVAHCMSDTELIEIAVDADVVKKYNQDKNLKLIAFYQDGHYELAEPDLRYQTWIKTKECDQSDWEEKKVKILRVRDIRIVLSTIAIIGFYRAPITSILCSTIGLISLCMYCVKINYPKTKKGGIITVQKEVAHQNTDSGTQEKPLLYDTWSDSKKYLYEVQQRLLMDEAMEEKRREEFSDDLQDDFVIPPELQGPSDETVQMPKVSPELVKSTMDYLIGLTDEQDE